MNVSSIHDCFGCGVCSKACSRHLIEIKLNKNGFYEPYIAESDKCSDCGLCIDVCSYSQGGLALSEASVSSYAAWSRDEAVRRKCSSGGVGFEVGRYLISQGYKVLGCRYDAGKNRAEHYVASTVEELIPSIGSKYIQSYTVDGLRQIDRKQKYLVTGTPCQIDSFRRYIQKFRCEENFVLMDFFCHGVPSMLVWRKYTKWAERQVGELTYVSWRNKQTGWHDSWAMAIDGKEHGEPINWHDGYCLLIREKKSYLNSRLSQGDMFYKLFLGNMCLGRACYAKCKFKYDHSSADIRIGDAWGETYKDDEKGVSTAIAFTEKGTEVLKGANVELRCQSLEQAAEGQMKLNPSRSLFCNLLLKALRNPNKDIQSIYTLYRKLKKCERLRNKLFRMLGFPRIE